MTDNEIIKALETCAKNRDTDAYCNECPYCNDGYCLDKMIADALSLINRQKATIKDLIANTNGIYERSIPAPMPMAQWLREELTEHVYNRCMEEL